MPFTDQDKKDIKNQARLAIVVETHPEESGLAQKSDLKDLLKLSNLDDALYHSSGLYQRLHDTIAQELSAAVDPAGDEYHKHTRQLWKDLIKEAVREVLSEGKE